jgi:hypothetical protein
MTRADKAFHKKLVDGLGNHAVSPAVSARYMLGESKYVNDSLIQYFVNYIIILANSPIVPLHLEEAHKAAKNLYCSLQELGLTGTIGRESVDTTEYLAV